MSEPTRYRVDAELELCQAGHATIKAVDPGQSPADPKAPRAATQATGYHKLMQVNPELYEQLSKLPPHSPLVVEISIPAPAPPAKPTEAVKAEGKAEEHATA